MSFDNTYELSRGLDPWLAHNERATRGNSVRLRDYQREALAEIQQAFRNGQTAEHVVMEAGAGKARAPLRQGEPVAYATTDENGRTEVTFPPGVDLRNGQTLNMSIEWQLRPRSSIGPYVGMPSRLDEITARLPSIMLSRQAD